MLTAEEQQNPQMIPALEELLKGLQEIQTNKRDLRLSEKNFALLRHYIIRDLQLSVGSNTPGNDGKIICSLPNTQVKTRQEKIELVESALKELNQKKKPGWHYESNGTSFHIPFLRIDDNKESTKEDNKEEVFNKVQTTNNKKLSLLRKILTQLNTENKQSTLITLSGEESSSLGNLLYEKSRNNSYYVFTLYKEHVKNTGDETYIIQGDNLDLAKQLVQEAINQIAGTQKEDEIEIKKGEEEVIEIKEEVKNDNGDLIKTLQLVNTDQVSEPVKGAIAIINEELKKLNDALNSWKKKEEKYESAAIRVSTARDKFLRTIVTVLNNKEMDPQTKKMELQKAERKFKTTYNDVKKGLGKIRHNHQKNAGFWAGGAVMLTAVATIATVVALVLIPFTSGASLSFLASHPLIDAGIGAALFGGSGLGTFFGRATYHAKKTGVRGELSRLKNLVHEHAEVLSSVVPARKE
jgi:hypothetical protein